ncbi:DUF4435 domain-containing protein [Burkholderia anthina]|uniref:DUF4435 domain-containing protein n=1 Tax=Burkholderia anthina TaxID=179879 RepID=UPI00158CE206|nr:DUF4435 domain-containing protein [Burkholderia anthina]
MASLTGQGLTSSQIKSRYAKRIEVFIEGQDDIAVYGTFWFKHLADRLQFRLAEDGPAKHSGCVGVEKNVAIQRTAGIDAYGIIDRDSLEDIPVACATDDNAFLASNRARDPYVYFTLRWELENYLVDPATWERERVDLLHRGAGQRLDQEVVEELVAHCEALIPHAAANAFRKERGKQKLGDGACRVYADRAEVQRFLDTNILTGLNATERAEYDAWVQRIEAFDEPTAPPAERLVKLCRRIHGKALLDRFCYRHRLQVDIRFAVARVLSGNVPSELNDAISGWIG